MLLEIRNLTKHYGTIQALDGVSFSLEAGEVLGVVGDNGAGKSTLMKCISGVQKPDSGAVVFDGRDVTRLSPQALREAGVEMIYQELGLCPLHDVTANIFLGRELKHKNFPFWLDERAMRTRATSLLDEFGTGFSPSQPVSRLSGGQRQIVALSRCLCFHPKLVIMDEPTSALALREVEHVLRIIRSLKEKGIAVIVISHRLADIFDVADRIILMRRGQVRQDSPVDQTGIREISQAIMGES